MVKGEFFMGAVPLHILMLSFEKLLNNMKYAWTFQIQNDQHKNLTKTSLSDQAPVSTYSV